MPNTEDMHDDALLPLVRARRKGPGELLVSGSLFAVYLGLMGTAGVLRAITPARRTGR
jgi:hypothetical protein